MKVGEAAVSVPDGSAVTVGGEVVLPPARAITSTSARAAALPLTELISTRTTLAGMSLKVTLVPLSESAPEVLLPTRFVPPVSLKSFTVAAWTLIGESAAGMLYRRTVRTVTGTGKVNCTHCVLGSWPERLIQYL